MTVLKKKTPIFRVFDTNSKLIFCDKINRKKIQTVMRMKMINICVKCSGKGQIRSKLPFFRKTCPVCNGTGKRETTIKNSKRA